MKNGKCNGDCANCKNCCGKKDCGHECKCKNELTTGAIDNNIAVIAALTPQQFNALNKVSDVKIITDIKSLDDDYYYNSKEPKYSGKSNIKDADESYGILNDYIAPFDDEIMEKDNTAMTKPELRGAAEYYPINFENVLPDPLRASILTERRNNTDLVDKIMDIDDECMNKKVGIIAKAISDLAATNREYNQLKYETLQEYNTVAGMHRSAAVMCTLIKNNKNDDKK